MQEVFEKMIEELEELKDGYDHSCLDNAYERGVEAGAKWTKKKAIEIVKQEAENFGTDINVGSNGWIPSSESLPCESGYYLVTYHEWSNGDYLPKYDDTYVRRLHYQRSEHFVGWNYPHCVDEIAEADTNREVIAWTDLPNPYQPKGECEL